MKKLKNFKHLYGPFEIDIKATWNQFQQSQNIKNTVLV